MTNQKTPEQGGAIEEQIEAAMFRMFPKRVRYDGDYFPNPGGAEKREGFLAGVKYAMELSASASAHPAGEHHDAAARGKLVLHYCPQHGDLILDYEGNEVTPRSARCREAHSVSEIAAHLRGEGQ